MFGFFCKRKQKVQKESDYLKKILEYEFKLYQKGIRYNYSQNLLENWQI